VARRAFFSFEYEHDVTRAMVVRKSPITQEKAGFIDAAEFERIKKKGDQAVRDWIDEQLELTTVTVVLVGEYTCSSKWVKYEIEKSAEKGNGMLGIDISKINDFNGNTSERCGKIPEGYEFHLWFKDDGYNNLGAWIEDAATAAGK
jgi:MTH538 TIR-like domain (DUF1863)